MIDQIKARGFRAGVAIGTMVAFIGAIGAPIKWS